MVPTADFVLAVPLLEKSSVGGILLPPSVTSRDNKRALIVAIGSKVVDLAAGDVVVLPQVGYASISQKGKEYYVIREKDVLVKWVDVDPETFDADVERSKEGVE